MDYRKYGETYSIRLDRDDEIISSILKLCEVEGIHSATFSGIGGCGRAYAPEAFYEYVIEGGNHARFGNYGEQKGDGAARITALEQQRQAAEQTVTGREERYPFRCETIGACGACTPFMFF